MPRKQSWYEENAQPLNWHRAFISGLVGALIMMSLVDIFYMMGITPFSFEPYLGSLILIRTYGTHIWTVGFFATLFMGGIFGLFYAFFFEFVYKRAGARNGIKVGFFHAVIAAVAIFPFFQAASEDVNLAFYPSFGFFGTALSPATPIILLFAHLVFGVTMGTFYGPVRMQRVQARYMEPEDTVYSDDSDWVEGPASRESGTEPGKEAGDEAA